MKNKTFCQTKNIKTEIKKMICADNSNKQHKKHYAQTTYSINITAVNGERVEEKDNWEEKQKNDMLYDVKR